MDAGSIASIIVASIALISAYASQRAASKASTKNVTIESRVDMERDAYTRARKFDLETIDRQSKEIGELRKRIDELELEVESLKKERKNERRNTSSGPRPGEPGSSTSNAGGQ